MQCVTWSLGWKSNRLPEIFCYRRWNQPITFFKLFCSLPCETEIPLSITEQKEKGICVSQGTRRLLFHAKQNWTILFQKNMKMCLISPFVRIGVQSIWPCTSFFMTTYNGNSFFRRRRWASSEATCFTLRKWNRKRDKQTDQPGAVCSLHLHVYGKLLKSISCVSGIFASLTCRYSQQSYCFSLGIQAMHFDRDDINLPGFHKFFKESSEEELKHAHLVSS